MPKLSNRITAITAGGSDGWDVFYRARAMVAAGIQVTELTIGEHDIRTHPSILDAMNTSAKGGHTGYAMVPGTTSLRETVAQRITERTGVATTPDNVMITPGGQSGLFSTHLAAANPGDTALYIDPYYATYPGTLRSLGLNPRAVTTRAEDDFQPNRLDLSSAAQGATCLLINSPNNPTGTVYSRETLELIGEISAQNDLWLISDEVYDTQVWEGAHLSPRALPDMADRTMVIGSMSKSHAMTGSRVGWIVANPDVIEKLVDLATGTTYGVPGFVQDAAEFALKAGPELEAEVGAPFLRRRTMAQNILKGHPHIGLIPAQGAMYLMLDIRSTGLTGEEFANALLDTHHIAVMPGESFGSSAAGHIRVAMTVDDTAFEKALTDLCNFAKEYAHAA